MARKIKNQNIDDKIISLADRISELESVKDSEFYKNQLTNIKSEIRHKEFRITVVGEFSCGKSTFLNALIGKDILPYAVEETTATITYIHNVPKGNKMENKSVVHFNEVGRKDETLDIVIERKKFQDYLSALNSNGDNIVKLVKSVDVYVNFSDLDEPIVFVDTPGLNGVADGHRNITIREVSRSHASICLFPIRGIGQTDLTFMKDLMKYQNTFFFVINQIDTLKSQEETAEKRIELFKEEVKANIYDGKTDPEYVFGISGLKALTSREKQIEYFYSEDKENGRRITDDERTRYWDESRFGMLEDALFKYLAGNDKDRQFYGSMILQMESILDDVEELDNDIKAIHETDPKELREETWLRKQLNTLLKNTETNRDNLTKAVNSKLGLLDKTLRTKIKSDCDAQYKVFEEKIDELNTKEDVEEFNVGEFSVGKAASAFYRDECDTIKNDIENECKDILQKSIEDVDDLIPTDFFKKNEMDKDDLPLTIEPFVAPEAPDEITQLKNKVQEYTNQIASLGKATADTQIAIESSQDERSKLERDRNKKVDVENSRRSSWTTQKKETRYVEKSGFWNGVKRLFGWGDEGNEEVTEYKTVYHNNYAEINRNIDKINAEYDPQISALKTKIEVYQKTIDTNVSMQEFYCKKKESAEQELKEAIKDQKEAQKNALTSWIKEQKKNMKNQVSELLGDNGEIYPKLAETIRKSIDKCKPKLVQNVEDYYNGKLSTYEKKINSAIKKLRDESNIAQTERKIEAINGELRTIAAYRKEIENINQTI